MMAWLLRALVVVGPVVAVSALGLTGEPPAWWVLAVVLVLSVAFALLPDSLTGMAVFVLVLAAWGRSVGTELPPTAMFAAGGLLVAHVCATVLAYGPPGLPVEAAILSRWTLRGLAALAAAPVLWGLAWVFGSQPGPPGLWLAGLVAAGAMAVLASLGFSSPSERIARVARGDDARP